MGEFKDPRKRMPESLSEMLSYSYEHKLALVKHGFRPVIDYLPEDAKQAVLDQVSTFSEEQLGAIITVQSVIPLVSLEDSTNEAISIPYFENKFGGKDNALSAFIAPWFLLEKMLEGTEGQPNFFDTMNTWPAVATRVKDRLQKLFARGVPDQMEVVKIAEDLASKIEKKYRDEIIVRDEFLKAAQPILEEAERTRKVLADLQKTHAETIEEAGKEQQKLEVQRNIVEQKLYRAQNLLKAKAAIERKYALLIKDYEAYKLERDAEVDELKKQRNLAESSSSTLAGEKTSLEAGLAVAVAQKRAVEGENLNLKNDFRSVGRKASRYALYTAASLLLAAYAIFNPVKSVKAQEPLPEITETAVWTRDGVELNFGKDVYVMSFSKLNEAYSSIRAREVELKRKLNSDERVEIVKKTVGNKFYSK